MKRSKRYREIEKKIDRTKTYDAGEAVGVLRELRNPKFDETFELSVKLGIDPKKLQQPVRGSVVLPHGTGKKIRIAVIAQGENVEKAQAAGADHVGGQDLIDKIKGGWLDFEAVVATPDMMKLVAPLGKVLGPRGLMPSPKTGTVTFDIAHIVSELRKGRVDFRMDKDANVQIPLGKASFETAQVADNLEAAIAAVVSAKPPTAKGIYIKAMSVCLTMSPSVQLNLNRALQQVKTAA